MSSDPPEARKEKFTSLTRHVLPSDDHEFVGRVSDLGIVQYHFETYEELAKYADCKYAFDVGGEVSSLSRRVESLNLAGDLLWPAPLPIDFKSFPISRYEWLTVAADVFLMRYVSVVDCAMLLANEVYEAGLQPKQCTIRNLVRQGVAADVIQTLRDMLDEQGALRAERNARFHHGVERGFTDDDQTFRYAALMEHRIGGAKGRDQKGREIDLDRMFAEGLVELQHIFNEATTRLIDSLNRLYDLLGSEFEKRFGPRIRAATHGLNSGARRAKA
jgi:hypothetical protein